MKIGNAILIIGWMAFSAYISNVKPEDKAVCIWLVVTVVSAICYLGDDKGKI